VNSPRFAFEETVQAAQVLLEARATPGAEMSVRLSFLVIESRTSAAKRVVYAAPCWAAKELTDIQLLEMRTSLSPGDHDEEK
jgi:hypothetical protein